MKCKHKWQPVDKYREEEYNFKENSVVYKDWIVTLVCLKCKRIKGVKVKELK